MEGYTYRLGQELSKLNGGRCELDVRKERKY